MMNTNKFENIHKELDFSKYQSTIIREETNCYSHAIGAESPCRIGGISELKPLGEKYRSKEELKTLFLEDLKTLGLRVEEIEISSKEDCLLKIEETDLEENQHLILLFAICYRNGIINDFHFWRYDSKEGLSEKYFYQHPNLLSYPSRSWTSSMKLVGMFRITR